ncbi:MAG: RidA family protein [Hymenobacter sp.]
MATTAFAQHKVTPTATATRTVIVSTAAPAPVGPYSQAIQVGGTVYVSGQIALDAATGQLVGNGDVKAETQQVMKNLTAVLIAAGLTLRDVAKCSIFVKDLASFAVINETYGSFFDAHAAPARETVQVSALPKGAQVEISCIAVKQ